MWVRAVVVHYEINRRDRARAVRNDVTRLDLARTLLLDGCASPRQSPFLVLLIPKVTCANTRAVARLNHAARGSRRISFHGAFAFFERSRVDGEVLIYALPRDDRAFN